MTDKTNPFLIKLAKALDTGHGEVSQIEVKEPTAAALMQYGIPFSEAGIDIPAAVGILSNCTGIQTPFLKNMGARDLMKCIKALGQHFEDEGVSEGN